MYKAKHLACAVAALALLALAAVVVTCTIDRKSGAVGLESSVEQKGARRVVGEPAQRRSALDRPSASRRRSDRRVLSRHADVPGGGLEAGAVPDDMSPEDRRLMDAIEQGRDDDDLDRLVKIIPEVSASTNAEVRAELVDAIGWFDVKGMNHLLPFMADPDDDVRESAIDNWTSALGEVEDEKMRAQMIGAVMQVLTDEDALESMVNELIDMDEKLALQTLVDVIEGGKAAPQGVATAREQYEFLTGEEYTNIDAANQWLAENYEPTGQEPDAAGGERKQ